jgi:hypothetical protein
MDIKRITGTFLQRATDEGHMWLKSYFRDHSENVIQTAARNSDNFLDKLAKEIKEVEMAGPEASARIDIVQDDPSFSAMLHEATIGAAQTSDETKHELLARLVAERMNTESEDLLAIASRMACEAIIRTTPTQLTLLGFLARLRHIRHPDAPLKPPSGEALAEINTWWTKWLEDRFQPYCGLRFKPIDVLHLGSLSLVRRHSILPCDLDHLLKIPQVSWAKFDCAAFIKNNRVGQEVERIFNAGANSVTLNSAGQILGICVADIISKSRTNMGDWGK